MMFRRSNIPLDWRSWAHRSSVQWTTWPQRLANHSPSTAPSPVIPLSRSIGRKVCLSSLHLFSCLLAFDSYFISSRVFPAGNTLPRNPIDILFFPSSFVLQHIYIRFLAHKSFELLIFMIHEAEMHETRFHHSYVDWISNAHWFYSFPSTSYHFLWSKASDPIRMLMFSSLYCLSWGYFSGCII